MIIEFYKLQEIRRDIKGEDVAARDGEARVLELPLLSYGPTSGQPRFIED
jgi:hypothetical protein